MSLISTPIFLKVALLLLLSHNSYATFHYKDIAPNNDFVLLRELNKELTQEPKTLAHTNPLCFFSCGKHGGNIFSYFSPEEAEEIFSKECPSCKITHVEKALIGELYNNIPKFVSVRGEDVESAPFTVTEDFAREVLRAGRDLRKKIPAGSTVLFPGRSPIWIKKAFDFINEKYPDAKFKSIHFSYSGQPDLEQFKNDKSDWFPHITTPKRIQFFREYIVSMGFDPKDKRPVYIVDHIDTGESLLALLKILVRFYQDTDGVVPEISFIDIGPRNLFNLKDHGCEKSVKFASGEHQIFFDPEGANRISYDSLSFEPAFLDALIEPEQDHSLGYYYPPYRWKDLYTPSRDKKPPSNALIIQTHLLNFWRAATLNPLASASTASVSSEESKTYSASTETAELLEETHGPLAEISELENFVSRLLQDEHYEPTEILVILDVDGTLTYFSEPADAEGNPATERPGALQLVKFLFTSSIKMVISSAHIDMKETLQKLDDIHILDVIGTSKYDRIIRSYSEYSGTTFNNQRVKNMISSVKMESDTYFYEKALSPFVLLTKADLARIKRVIFVDDNPFMIEKFKARMKTALEKYGPSLQKVDYFELTPHFKEKAQKNIETMAVSSQL